MRIIYYDFIVVPEDEEPLYVEEYSFVEDIGFMTEEQYQNIANLYKRSVDHYVWVDFMGERHLVTLEDFFDSEIVIASGVLGEISERSGIQKAILLFDKAARMVAE